MCIRDRYGVKPDIVTMAKALGCGIPVGAFAAVERVAKALVPGDHGTTYGGNPLACAAVSKVFDLFEELRLVDHVKEVSDYLETRLDTLIEKYDVVKARRGKGFMQGLELTIPAGEIILKALDLGLVLMSAGSQVIRLVPPLVITREHIDEMMEKLQQAVELALSKDTAVV